MIDRVKLLVVDGDSHSGSTAAILPPGFVTNPGENHISQNAVQAQLWLWWRECLDTWLPSILGSDPWDCIHMGDAVEGIHHWTTEIISPEPSDHGQAFLSLMRSDDPKAPGLLDLPNRQKFFAVTGTEVHTRNTETSLAHMLGAERCPMSHKYSANQWRLEYNGQLCSFQHHCSATSRLWLESGEFSRMLTQEQSACVRNSQRAPDIVVRAHRHRYGMFSDGQSMAIVSPAWQALTRHGHKAVVGEIPRVGMFALDWRDKEPGELPTVHPFLRAFPLPPEITR